MSTWIDINERKPKKAGWYKVMMPQLKGEYEAPFVRNGKGELVWVVPDETLITHWQEKEPQQECGFEVANKKGTFFEPQINDWLEEKENVYVLTEDEFYAI